MLYAFLLLRPRSFHSWGFTASINRLQRLPPNVAAGSFTLYSDCLHGPHHQLCHGTWRPDSTYSIALL